MGSFRKTRRIALSETRYHRTVAHRDRGGSAISRWTTNVPHAPKPEVQSSVVVVVQLMNLSEVALGSALRGKRLQSEVILGAD